MVASVTPRQSIRMISKKITTNPLRTMGRKAEKVDGIYKIESELFMI